MLRVAFALRSTEVHPVFLDLFARVNVLPRLMSLATLAACGHLAASAAPLTQQGIVVLRSTEVHSVFLDLLARVNVLPRLMSLATLAGLRVPMQTGVRLIIFWTLRWHFT